MPAARLFTTIVRFDVAYHGNFKCNLGTIRHDYPAIDRWLRNLYWNYPAFRETTRYVPSLRAPWLMADRVLSLRFDHIKNGYYGMSKINPTGVVPLGPRPDILPLDKN